MGMGKTVVLSDLKVSREIVQDGVTGLLCKAGNPRSLASTLERLARDSSLRHGIGRSAREWVVANRNWDLNAATLEKVYNRLAPI
jgi:glycosyltransferase involved in cell wall biosynthesis